MANNPYTSNKAIVRLGRFFTAYLTLPPLSLKDLEIESITYNILFYIPQLNKNR